MRIFFLLVILLTQLLMAAVDAARPFGFGRQQHSVSTTSTPAHHDDDHNQMTRAEGSSSQAVSDVVSCSSSSSRRIPSNTDDDTKSFTRQCKDEPGDDRSARYAFCRDGELKALQRTEHAYVMEGDRNGQVEDSEKGLTPCQRLVPRDESRRLGGGAFGSDLLVA